MKAEIWNQSFEEKVIICLFVLLSLWWVFLFFVLKNQNIELNLAWGALYQVVAILGSFFGLSSSVKWGGFKSVIGRSLLMFSLGLFFQAFGQSVFSYYNLIAQIEVPYPSLSDIGFFGSIPFYVYGAILLGRASGVGKSLHTHFGKFVSFSLLVLMLGFSYCFFLNGYDFRGANWTKVFLDFGYPIGQTVYVSIAVLAYLLSKDVLGGVMRKYILWIFVALAFQYISDFNFLYQASLQTWVNGGYGDYLYLVSYFVMALGLVKLKTVFKGIRNA